MRTTIACFIKNGQIIPVLSLYGRKEFVDLKVLDRIANEDAFPGEFSIRLPRRLGVDSCHVITGKYITSRYHSNGKRNRNVY